MEYLETIVTSLQPVMIMAIGLITVQAQRGLKLAIPFLNSLPSWLQPFLTVGVAALLTLVGSSLNVVLPGELALITFGDIETLISAGIAMGWHAGMKAREK